MPRPVFQNGVIPDPSWPYLGMKTQEFRRRPVRRAYHYPRTVQLRPTVDTPIPVTLQSSREAVLSRVQERDHAEGEEDCAVR